MNEKGAATMKKLLNLFNILLWCFVGAFAGSSIFKYYDYKTHPDLYAMQSAPWYLSIAIAALFTAIVVVVIIGIMWILKKKIK